MNFDYEKHTILRGVGGSHAYGLNVEDSDIDYVGIIIPPKDYFLGLYRFDQYEGKHENGEYHLHDIRKFFRLALKSNPNILEILFLDKYEIVTPYGQRILDIRHEFISRNCLTPYLGYANSQLKRFQKLTWENVTSERRLGIIKNAGYDAKYAMHLIRLLKTGIEVLTTGQLIVKRPDRQMLLDIRNGLYTFEQIVIMSRTLYSKLEACKENNVLKSSPDYKKVNDVLVSIVEDFLKGK